MLKEFYSLLTNEHKKELLNLLSREFNLTDSYIRTSWIVLDIIPEKHLKDVIAVLESFIKRYRRQYTFKEFRAKLNAYKLNLRYKDKLENKIKGLERWDA